MTLTRFDIERCALAPQSDLPAISRYLVLILCTRIDKEQNRIKDQHQPSLTTLVRLSRVSRSTVCVHLNILERRGWLKRRRPTRHEARTQHARTHYSIRVPDLVRLVVLGPGPGDGPDLVRQPSTASPAGAHKSSRSSRSSARARGEEATTPDLTPSEVAVVLRITETLRDVAPSREEAHTPAWARRVADSIPGGTKNRAAYVEQVIRSNPSAYLPTPQPAPFRAPSRKDTTR